jgi:tetratricopeptide (TPR) repeat protein
MTTNTSNAFSPAAYGQGMGKGKLLSILAVLWVCAILVQARIDTRRHYYNPILNTPGKGFMDSLRNNMFGASMLGFREVAAGMLWVKADELFHEGKYQELVPYFSLVTFMDPHQVDVYSTGAWHLMYNFGDARMVPQGLAFLKEGIANNSKVWDLYFQMGWSNFDWPVEDYGAARPYFEEAIKWPSTDGSPPPRYIAHMIAHCLARQGKVAEARKAWTDSIAYADKEIAKATAAKDENSVRLWGQERDVCKLNLNLVIVRQADRKDLPSKLKSVSLDTQIRNSGKRILGLKCRVVGLPPLRDDMGEVSNARLEIVVQDKDYDTQLAAHSNDLAWGPKHLTKFRSIYNIVEQDGSVLYQKKPWIPLDMSKDTMLDPPRKPEELFPLESKEYEVIIRLDPRVRRQPQAVQDVLGWIGEGLAPGRDVVRAPDNGRKLEKRIIVPRELITGS